MRSKNKVMMMIPTHESEGSVCNRDESPVNLGVDPTCKLGHSDELNNDTTENDQTGATVGCLEVSA